ncbi:AAA family ATPase [Rhizobium leguminosarum]|uniref:trifunctional serine/threonine-protein kinase/ATP-binding protein/sensor histidine kinase n=1 Tax=Rhizobium leguminosarum TaxID=384 RepID=UPI001C953A72|nr:AAA family ATPase [Rhizobium leguminosarum]MBY5603670.1 AAA family ATPase [Rhizobium leguminosarum]
MKTAPPVNDDPEFELRHFRDGTDFTFYRGKEQGGRRRVLGVARVAHPPFLQKHDRLLNEYSLASQLDPAWSARPVKIIDYRGQDVLILEDPGGEPLDLVIEQQRDTPFDLSRFLRIASGLSAAVGQVHSNGLVHKDIKPANILVNGEGRAWLTGFGLASQIPLEWRTTGSPESIVGTLAYMAPEQTGRINRVIDSRSDLYSLGVTLYEALTGELPFSTSDPIELVHSHIARPPTSPTEQVEGIPEVVSAILMKLLAKPAEERFQTARGLERDFRRCLEEWEAKGWIENFPLGEFDETGRLAIPEKIFGRALETSTMLGALERVASGNGPELVIVSGRPGVGKSSLVHEVYGRLISPEVLFASGKFDQYLRDIPYATVAQAFSGLLKHVLSRDQTELLEWRTRFEQALGANVAFVVGLIPELALIVGDQPAMPELPSKEAQRRFHAVLRRFIGVFARPERPLALFLDDLQWADAATIDLLSDLVRQDEISHLLLIGAYRSGEMQDEHPLMRSLGSLRTEGARVQDVSLQTLGTEDLVELVGNSLRCDQIARPLGKLVHEKTGGNPFFAIQFLQALEREALIVWDHGYSRWKLDADAVRARDVSDNVIDLMVANLNRLSIETVAVLCQLACFGTFAKVDQLAELCGIPAVELHEVLSEAVQAGVVVYSNESYTFKHDRIHEASYLRTPEGARAQSHLRIAHLLTVTTVPEELDGAIFQIVSQFNKSLHLIVSPEERAQVAALNLAAAKRSKDATAYTSALTYLAAGRMLLAGDCWGQQRALAFDLELQCAECEFLTGDLAAAETRLSMSAQKSTKLGDRAAVTRLQIDLYIIMGRPGSAVEVGLAFLKAAGLELPPQPKDADVRHAYASVWQELGTRRIEDLIDLPRMNDPDTRATIDVVTKLVLSALYQDPKLHQLLIALMVQLSLQHGNTAASCVGYVSFARVLITEFDQFSDALSFGQLSLALLERDGFDTFKARVYFSFGTGISSWSQHLRVGLTFIRQALDQATADGDLPYIGYCHSNIVGNLLSAGEPLADVEKAALEGFAFARKSGSRIAAALITGQLRLIRSLKGLPPNFETSDGHDFDADGFERGLTISPYPALVSDIYWSRRMQAFVFEKDYASALEAAARASTHLSTPYPNIEAGEYHFYAALARAGSIGTARPNLSRQERLHLEALRAHQRRLEKWAEASKDNLHGRTALVGAELARLEQRELDAELLYAEAIRFARSGGFVQNEALAYELGASFYNSRGLDEIAAMYLSRALDAYERWGADGILRRFEPNKMRRARTAGREIARTTSGPVEHFDVAAVLKASQALSGEMLLPRLIERLMRIAIEHAGAERGVLVLSRDGNDKIAAEAVTRPGGIEVSARNSSITSSDLPQSVVQLVNRTYQSALLDDALSDRIHRQDDYVVHNRARSILCLPILRQTKLVGQLYLENNLTPGAFTAERVAILDLLALQAAISLENAGLFTDLQRSETFLVQGQMISQTGSFGWRAASREFFWSSELYNILEYASDVRASAELALARIHPDDRGRVRELLETARGQERDFDSEHRLLMPDGRIKYVHTTGRAVATDDLDFVGSVRDVTERVRSEETLRQVRSDLAHVARVTTLNAMTASIAHEVNQPLSGILTNAHTGARFLAADPPDLEGVAETIRRTIRDAKRASDVITGLRAMFQKHVSTTEMVDVNVAAREVIALSTGELLRNKAIIETDFLSDQHFIRADRVQLQQVILNLLLNAIEAMADVHHRPRTVLLRTRLQEGGVRLDVKDCGVGVKPETAQKLFDAFYTTKEYGMGIGLSICRSIIDGLGGRLWVAVNEGPGTTFSFIVPLAQEASDTMIEEMGTGPPASK